MFGFTNPATAPGRRTSSAIAWIDRARAIVARTQLDGAIGVDEVDRESQEEDWHFLTRVADQIGDRDQVVIMGARRDAYLARARIRNHLSPARSDRRPRAIPVG